MTRGYGKETQEHTGVRALATVRPGHGQGPAQRCPVLGHTYEETSKTRHSLQFPAQEAGKRQDGPEKSGRLLLTIRN